MSQIGYHVKYCIVFLLSLVDCRFNVLEFCVSLEMDLIRTENELCSTERLMAFNLIISIDREL